MQVDGKNAVNARLGKQVGNQLGGNRNATFVFAVLTSVSVIRDNGGNARGAGAAERVDHNQQFHQRFVDVASG